MTGCAQGEVDDVPLLATIALSDLEGFLGETA